MEDDKKVLNEAPNELNEGVRETSETVSYDTHKRTLAQRAKLKEERDALNAELEKFRQAEREREEAKLKEQGEYKKLLEAKEERIRQLEGNTREYEQRFVNAHKLNAFKEALGAGLRKPEYYDFVELEKIVIDPDTGLVDHDSLAPVVDDFRTKYDELVDRGARSKELPNQAPPTEVDMKEELSLKDQLKLLGKTLTQ